MKKYDKLIFVDEDDTTRAPMAAAIMREKYLLSSLKICSRGLVVLFQEPINQKAEAILASHGLTAKDHAAEQLMQEDIGDRVLLLTMEDAQKEKIWTSYSNARNVFTIAEYVNLRGDLAPVYGEPLVGYGKCFETLEALINGLVIKLNEEELKK